MSIAKKGSDSQFEEQVGPDSGETEKGRCDEGGTREVRFWRLGLLSGVVLALPLLGFWGSFVGVGQWGAELKNAGWWVVPVYLLLCGSLTGLALLPSHLSSLLAGYLFGFPGGFSAALGVVFFGSGLGYSISRCYTGDDLRKMVDRSKWGRRLGAALIDAPFFKALLAIALVRLPPQVPFALANVLAASGGVRLFPFLAGTALGMAPRVGLVVWVGTELAEWEFGAPVPSALLWAVAAGVVGFGGLALWSWILLRQPEREN